MKYKKKILMCGEFHEIKSGFGLYTREVLSRLHNSGKYEIAELSCYNTGVKEKKVPWVVYPNAVERSHKEFTNYNSHSINQFGQWRFDKTVLDFKPDIVFDIRDFWMLSYQEVSPLRKYFNWVIAPTIDSLPQKENWLHTFQNADLVLGHTDWAVEYLEKLNRNIKVGPSISDSVDTDVFSPISYGKRFHRSKNLVPADSFIIGSVMRNQQRKLIPELLDSIQQLIQFTQNRNIFLYLHTSYPEATGWDIPSLLQDYNMMNNTLFTYYCVSCGNFFGSTYKGPSIQCVSCNKTASFPNVINGVSEKQLADIYNLFDFYVQYAICEGLGIPQLEAASCGVPICSVDYSAMSEVTSKLEGYKIEYTLKREIQTEAYRAVPNNSHLVQIIYEYMKLSPEQKQIKSERTRSLIVENYSWEKTTEKIMEIFDKMTPKNCWNIPMTYDKNVHVEGSTMSNRSFIYSIIKNILKEKRLIQTYFIQEMIKDLDQKFLSSENSVTGYDRQRAIASLNKFLNNKILLEKIRSNEIKMEDDFIKYAHE